MKLRLLFAIVCGLALTFAASAQDMSTTPAGQRGGRGAMGMGAGRGLLGTVTEVAADHYTIKTDTGESYTIHFDANTRLMKQMARQRGAGAGEQSAPQTLKPSDIKVGDAVVVMGEVDAAAKSVGAMMVMQLDPERAKQMREMQANYGKTWLMGKVTAIDGVKVTLLGTVDNAARVFVADENTDFRERREPITLADIQVGQMVRVEGAVKDGNFVAATVSVMGMPPGEPPAAPQPK
jgi:hypothetical protein